MFLIASIVTTSKALVTSSDALVPSLSKSQRPKECKTIFGCAAKVEHGGTPVGWNLLMFLRKGMVCLCLPACLAEFGILRDMMLLLAINAYSVDDSLSLFLLSFPSHESARKVRTLWSTLKGRRHGLLVVVRERERRE